MEDLMTLIVKDGFHLLEHKGEILPGIFKTVVEQNSDEQGYCTVTITLYAALKNTLNTEL